MPTCGHVSGNVQEEARMRWYMTDGRREESQSSDADIVFLSRFVAMFPLHLFMVQL